MRHRSVDRNVDEYRARDASMWNSGGVRQVSTSGAQGPPGYPECYPQLGMNRIRPIVRCVRRPAAPLNSRVGIEVRPLTAVIGAVTRGRIRPGFGCLEAGSEVAMQTGIAMRTGMAL